MAKPQLITIQPFQLKGHVYSPRLYMSRRDLLRLAQQCDHFGEFSREEVFEFVGKLILRSLVGEDREQWIREIEEENLSNADIFDVLDHILKFCLVPTA